MASPRLPFLWPFLYLQHRAQLAQVRSRYAQKTFSTSGRRKQAAVSQRYGTANEPLLPPSKPATKSESGHDGPIIDVKALSKPSARARGDKSHQELDALSTADSDSVTQDKHAERLAAHSQAVTSHPKAHAAKHGHIDRSSLGVARPHVPRSGKDDEPARKAADTVLNMPPSDSVEMATIPSYYERDSPLQGGDHRPPHIATPQFIHHFDTYGLVKDLEAGGWSNEQSVTIMKAVRSILVENIKLASEGLVSKSNVENETYLFRAACSELKTEINTKRKAETEKSGTQRTQIQHEVDILSQKLVQQGAVLKDELKGMFDDRKMAVRNEQRSMESKIQELNYRITVVLNSDSRSDVEGVRWIITKRAITALAICVLMVLSSLKYSSITHQAQEEERKRFADMAALAASSPPSHNPSHSNGSNNSGGSAQVRGRNASEMPIGGGVRDDSYEGRERRVYGIGEVIVQEGDNPSFVSLG